MASGWANDLKLFSLNCLCNSMHRSLQKDYKLWVCKSHCYAKEIRLQKRFVSFLFLLFFWMQKKLCFEWCAMRGCPVLKRHWGLDSVSSRKHTRAQGHRESQRFTRHTWKPFNWLSNPETLLFTPDICGFTAKIHYTSTLGEQK